MRWHCGIAFFSRNSSVLVLLCVTSRPAAGRVGSGAVGVGLQRHRPVVRHPLGRPQAKNVVRHRDGLRRRPAAVPLRSRKRAGRVMDGGRGVQNGLVGGSDPPHPPLHCGKNNSFGALATKENFDENRHPLKYREASWGDQTPQMSFQVVQRG